MIRLNTSKYMINKYGKRYYSYRIYNPYCISKVCKGKYCKKIASEYKVPDIINYLINNPDKGYENLIMRVDLPKGYVMKSGAIPVAGTITNGAFEMKDVCWYFLKSDVVKKEC